MEKIKAFFKQIKENLSQSKLNLAIFISCIIVIFLSVWLLILLLTREEEVTTSFDGIGEVAVETGKETGEEIEKESSTEDESEALTDSEKEQDERIQAEIKKSNQWSGDGGHFMQYDINLTNVSKDIVSDWELVLTFSGEITVSQGWGGTFTSEGKRLIIQPVDYTKEIPVEEVRNLGVIISGGEDIVVTEYEVKIKDETQHVKYEEPVREDETQESVTENMSTQESATPGQAEVQTHKQNQNAQSSQQQGNQQNTVGTVTTGTVSEHGRLHVNGRNIVDERGNVFQIQGVSTHGLAWFGEYVNLESFRALKNMGVNTIRLAMYTSEYGGYCNGGDREQLKKLVNNGVQYATELDMYVIIDWHILSDGNPKTYENDAVQFFSEMAGRYASYSNVLYEICNEPNNGTDWNTIRDYANRVIATIREKDKDAIIIVGTPNWSQYVDEASLSPITGYDNIVYALHFYAATHKDELRQKLETAVRNQLPLLVSEFSICDASGNGGIDINSANTWMNLLDFYGIGYVAWNLSNKQETSSLLQSSCAKLGGFTYEDLSETGKWYSSLLQSKHTMQ